MGEGKTERIAIGDLLVRMQKLMDEGWHIRSVMLDYQSVGRPGAWTEPEEWYYHVRAVWRHPEAVAA